MVTLYLLRHAKAANGEPGMADEDRPLAPRGRRDAQALAGLVAERRIEPQRILCSPARRTRETLDLVIPDSAAELRTAFEPRIYGAGVEQLLALIRDQPRGVTSLLMIGHNPGFEGLAGLLSGHGEKRARDRLAQGYPTCGLATIAFELEDWAAVAPGLGALTAFDTPA